MGRQDWDDNSQPECKGQQATVLPSDGHVYILMTPSPRAHLGETKTGARGKLQSHQPEAVDRVLVKYSHLNDCGFSLLLQRKLGWLWPLIVFLQAPTAMLCPEVVPVPSGKPEDGTSASISAEHPQYGERASHSFPVGIWGYFSK